MPQQFHLQMAWSPFFSFSSWTLSYRTSSQRLSRFFMLLLSFKAWHANQLWYYLSGARLFLTRYKELKIKVVFFCKVTTTQTPDPTNTLLWEFPDKNMFRRTYWVGWQDWEQTRLKVIIRVLRWNSRVEERFGIGG